MKSAHRVGWLVLGVVLGCATGSGVDAAGERKPGAVGAAAAVREVPCRAGGATARLPADAAAGAREYVKACGLAEAVALTGELVAFPTVREDKETFDAAADGMAKVLEAAARNLGGTFRAVDTREVYEIAFGDPEAPVGVAFVTHGDVVPVGESWTKKPYEAVVEEGLLYGRGSEDDKGPIAAALVAMRALSSAGYRPKERVQVIIGMGEESDWNGMVKYARETPKPRHVISLDANFPVVISEFGFVSWSLVSEEGDGGAGKTAGKTAEKPVGQQQPCAKVTAAAGGSFLTQVPLEATATLLPPRGEPAAKFLARVQGIAGEDALARGAPFGAEVSPGPGGQGVVVKTTGKSVHSSVADKGANPLWPLSAIAVRAGACKEGAGRLLHVLAGRFDGDHHGQKLGVHYSDPVMGRLLAIPTVLKASEGRATLGVNMRRPAGMDNAAFQVKLQEALAALVRDYGPLKEDESKRFLGEPHVADVKGPLMPTLLSIYGELTGDKDPKPVTIRGGTYARLFPGAVSFGPELPGKTYRGHAPDEAIELPTLELMTKAALEAVLRLDAGQDR